MPLHSWWFFALRRDSSHWSIHHLCTHLIANLYVPHLLVVDFIYRELQYFLCLLTIVLDLSASLKVQRPWKEVRSTSACTTNGSLFSGCRRTSHRLVEIPARYVLRFSCSPRRLYHNQLQVTIFGQSAGAMSISYFYLNEDFSTVARAAVRALSRTLTRCLTL